VRSRTPSKVIANVVVVVGVVVAVGVVVPVVLVPVVLVVPVVAASAAPIFPNGTLSVPGMPMPCQD